MCSVKNGLKKEFIWEKKEAQQRCSFKFNWSKVHLNTSSCPPTLFDLVKLSEPELSHTLWVQLTGINLRQTEDLHLHSWCVILLFVYLFVCPRARVCACLSEGTVHLMSKLKWFFCISAIIYLWQSFSHLCKTNAHVCDKHTYTQSSRTSQ